eukprot:GHUV01030068.1.p1 GENE.GHUV01030068.1~~GHUV01030068.1.p1  ORF type:complete len:501 (+),score=142.74 GHUV01030068.1:330-1832(+)
MPPGNLATGPLTDMQGSKQTIARLHNTVVLVQAASREVEGSNTLILHSRRLSCVHWLQASKLSVPCAQNAGTSKLACLPDHVCTNSPELLLRRICTMLPSIELPRVGTCSSPGPPVVPALCSADKHGAQLRTKSTCLGLSLCCPATILKANASRRPTAVVVAATATAGRIAPSQERLQHVTRDKAAERRRKSVNVAKLLTNHIIAADTLEQLHDVLAMHGSVLDHIHVAALLSRTAHICASLEQQQATSAANSDQQQQQADQQQAIQQQQLQDRQQLLVTRLTEMMVQRLRHAKAPTLVAAVAALGRLSSMHGTKAAAPQQLQQFAAKTLELLPKLNLSQLAVVSWGLAKAGYKPPTNWLEPVLTSFLQQYQDAAAAQQELQQPVQQQQPDPRLQRPVLPTAGISQQQRLPYLPNLSQRPTHHTLATDLSLVIYSLAVMGKQPGPVWLAQWQAAVVQQLPSANMQDLSQALWALAQLGVGSGNEKWLQQMLAAAQPLLFR